MNPHTDLSLHTIRTVLGRLAVHDSGAPAGAAGAAPVLVFWHSILADHHIYDAQVAALRQRHRLLLIDGPAHGASEAADGRFSMAQCAQAQAEVLDALGIVQPVVAVGTSWGGLVAGEFALHYPQRTRAVMLFNTPVHTSKARLRDAFVAWGARWLNGTKVYVNGVAEGYFMPATRARETGYMAQFRQHIHARGGKALAQVVRSVLLDREDLSARLAQIAAPTLFVAGTHDTMCLLEDQRRAAALLQRGSFVELPTAHIAVKDAPEAANRVINRFLSEL